jgi:cytoskeletal protein CcmA (bactofilin family)
VAARKKADMLDGLATVRAVRRAKKNVSGPRTKPSRTKLPAAQKKKKKPAAKPAAGSPRGRFGHTVVPEKHAIACFDCGYAFTLTGKLRKTICPKCHATLDIDDHTIEGEWTGPLKTLGSIEIKADAVLTEADIVARDVVLMGDAKDAAIEAFRRLEIGKDAAFDAARIKARDYCFGRGGKYTFTRRLVCRDLEVGGDLKAKIVCEGVVTIRSGGLLRGEVRGGRLVVEEGGGLKARVTMDS